MFRYKITLFRQLFELINNIFLNEIESVLTSYVFEALEHVYFRSL